MPRKSKHAIPDEKKALLMDLIKTYDVRTTVDLQEALKDLLGGTIQMSRRDKTVKTVSRWQNHAPWKMPNLSRNESSRDSAGKQVKPSVVLTIDA